MFKYFRMLFRKILPEAWKHRVSLIPDYIRSLGLINGVGAYFRISLRNRGIVKVSIRRYRYPILIRADSSDVKIFEEIFIYNSYEIPVAFPLPEFIIDGGANAGYASIFFANKYPKAKIIAVEPERLNYEILKKNTGLYHNISAIEAGIWNKEVFFGNKKSGSKIERFSGFRIRSSIN